jgi:hypothetical protein
MGNSVAHQEAMPKSTRIIYCESWEDYKEQVRLDYAEEVMGISPLFRGHARSEWRLASPWDRRLESWGLDAGGKINRKGHEYLLAKILRDFKDLAIGLPGLKSRELDELDWWALGRHHGLVTPLLDWTRSPYVAAFFAFTGFIEQVSPGSTASGYIDAREFVSANMSAPVAIWAFMVGNSIDKATEVKILNPRIDMGHRQRAQRGLFTQLTHDEYFDMEDYLSSLEFGDDLPLRKYLIPGREAAKAITDLRMMNITFSTLFPDLEGAALQANFEVTAFSLMTIFSFVRRDAWKAGEETPSGGRVASA